ncbi:MAG: hypothetical protein QOE87_366 [Gaiellales bacterium]|nr:hypothetical protein [Gaiellales bacterium]
MTRLTLSLVAIVLVAVACRTPGQPPTRPTQGEYRDIIRRELDSAGSALASGELVLRYVEARRLPDTYAAVTLRQAANDLRKVAQDLGEIQSPQRATRAQARLRAICRRDGRSLTIIHTHLDDLRQRRRVRIAITRDARVLVEQLGKQLDSG